MTKLPIRLTESQFEDLYHLQRNHLSKHASFDGCQFEPFGAELAFIKEQDPANVWTVLYVDGGAIVVASGMHFVNRAGYLLTANPAPIGACTEVEIVPGDLARQNDLFRETLGAGLPGKLVMTQGIAALSAGEQASVIEQVRIFDSFTPGNDPYGEHDCGGFEHRGKKVLWKIDYYDSSYQWGSEDPADPECTRRVLTILFGEEY